MPTIKVDFGPLIVLVLIILRVPVAHIILFNKGGYDGR